MRSAIIPFIFLWMVSNGQRIEVPQLNSQFKGQTHIGSAQVDFPYNSGAYLITPLPEVTNRISTIFPSLSKTSIKKNLLLPGSQISTNREISNLDISSISTNGQLSHLPISNNGPLFVSTTPSTLIDQIPTIFPTLPSTGRRKFLTAPLNYKGPIFNLPNSQISFDSPISINSHNPPTSIPSVASTPISSNRDRLSQSLSSVNREILQPPYASIHTPKLVSEISNEGQFNIPSLIPNNIDTRTSFDKISNQVQTGNTAPVNFATLSKTLQTFQPNPNRPTEIQLKGTGVDPTLNMRITPTSQYLKNKISNKVQSGNTAPVNFATLSKTLQTFQPNPNSPTQIQLKGTGVDPTLNVKITPTSQYPKNKISNEVQSGNTVPVNFATLSKTLQTFQPNPNRPTGIQLKGTGVDPTLNVEITPTSQYLENRISNQGQTDNNAPIKFAALNKTLQTFQPNPNRPTEIQLKGTGVDPTLNVKITPTSQYLKNKISNQVQTDNSAPVDIATLNKTLQGVPVDPNKPTQLKVTSGNVPLNVKITRTDQYLADEWAAFKKRYNKVYSSEMEDNYRKVIFMGNMEKINNYNDMYSKGMIGFSSKMNNYGDMLHDEFAKSLNGFDATDILDEKVNPRGSYYIQNENIYLPVNVDWRLKGAVTPVKQQGMCKSCYAFAAAGALEGQYYRRYGLLRNLSAQDIIDCSGSYKNMGCNTGRMSQTYIYIKESGGIKSEKVYGYEGKNGECRHQTDDFGASITGYMTLKRYDEYEMQVALAANGPIAAAIDAGQKTFQFFGEGIYDDPECNNKPSQLNHAVLIIGYGQEPDGKKYWLVKNTYGSAWGEDGYIKIARGINQCGISTETSFPLV